MRVLFSVGKTGQVFQPLHDAACAAWSLKRFYDGGRPIAYVRFMAQLGQSSDPGGAAHRQIARAIQGDGEFEMQLRFGGLRLAFQSLPEVIRDFQSHAHGRTLVRQRKRIKPRIQCRKRTHSDHVEVIPLVRRLEPEMFGEVFHGNRILTTVSRAEASSEGGDGHR